MSARAETALVLTAEGLSEVPWSEMAEELARLAEPLGPVTWVQTDWHPGAVQALEDMGLDEIAVRSLRGGPERPRVEEFADHLYVSLFAAEPTDAADAPLVTDGEVSVLDRRIGRTLPSLRELRLFMGPRWVISVGRLDPAWHAELAERMRRQVFSRDRGASFIAYHICEWAVESLQPALDELDERIDSLEDQVVLASGEAPMQELFGLKRDLVDLRRRAAPLRDVMQRLGSHGVLFVEPEAEVYFRDVRDDVTRAIELLDTYRDILSSALDLHLSSVSNRLNRVMKQLTVVATMFMPLSFLVGLFGVNFRQMPFGSLGWFVAMFALMFVSVLGMLVYTWRRT